MALASAARALGGAYNIEDLRRLAHRRLPRGIFDYVERGTEDEVGLAANRHAFDRLKLLPHVLNDVSAINTTASLFGTDMAMPVIVGPTGGAGLVWHDGDLALAAAARKAGVPFTISSASTANVEDVADIGGRLWFQLYLWEDRALSHQVVDRAHALGCEALIVTVDTAVAPNREYNLRNGYGIPFRIRRNNILDIIGHPRWVTSVMLRYALSGGMPRQANLPPHLRARVTEMAPIGAAFRNDNLTWEEIAGLRRRWPGKFMIKGILRPDDARRAIEHGVDGVIVSNHGGRNLDAAAATIDMLPRVLDAVGGRVPVLVDSGVRRGGDVVKALALGAAAVLVGRAPLYGLAAAGEAGVSHALALLHKELARVMALCGCTSIGEIDKDLLQD